MKWSIHLLLGTLAIASIGKLHGADSAVFYEQKLPEYGLSPIAEIQVGAGKKYRFVMDGGAGIHAVDPALRPVLGTEVGVTPFDSETGKSHSAPLIRSPELMIGKLKIPPSDCALIDLESARMAIGVDIRGVLSLEQAFPNCQVRLNFDQKSLMILDASAPVPDNMQTLEMSYIPVGGVSIVEGEFFGRNREFIIDTGSSGGIGLDGALYSELVSKGVIKNRSSLGDVATAGEVIQVRRGTFQSGKWFGVDLKGLSVFELHGRCSIGMEFLLRLDSILDYSKHQFHYKVRETFPPRVVCPEVIIFRQGKNPVFKIGEGDSREKRAGIRDGDEIIRLDSVDGAKMNVILLFETCQRFRGKDIEIEVLHRGDKTPIVTKLTLIDDE